MSLTSGDVDFTIHTCSVSEPLRHSYVSYLVATVQRQSAAGDLNTYCHSLKSNSTLWSRGPSSDRPHDSSYSPVPPGKFEGEIPFLRFLLGSWRRTSLTRSSTCTVCFVCGI